MSDYQEHLDRIMAAVRIEPVDRIPVMQSGSACNAAFCGKTLKEYCDDPVINTDCNLEAAGMWGEVDGTQATCFQPRDMARMWLGRVLMPGHDPPENELWQMAEQEVVSQEETPPTKSTLIANASSTHAAQLATSCLAAVMLRTTPNSKTCRFSANQ